MDIDESQAERVGGKALVLARMIQNGIAVPRGLCITPTRAALEATEAYRQANKLGRGGGVTNGWAFWEPVVS